MKLPLRECFTALIYYYVGFYYHAKVYIKMYEKNIYMIRVYRVHFQRYNSKVKSSLD